MFLRCSSGCRLLLRGGSAVAMLSSSPTTLGTSTLQTLPRLCSEVGRRFDPNLPEFRHDAIGRRRLFGVLLCMVLESALSKLDRFGNCFLGNAAAPFRCNGVPRHSLGDLFQHLRHHDPRAQEGWLAMTDFGINDEIAPKIFLCFLVMVFYPPMNCSELLLGHMTDSQAQKNSK